MALRFKKGKDFEYTGDWMVLDEAGEVVANVYFDRQTATWCDRDTPGTAHYGADFMGFNKNEVLAKLEKRRAGVTQKSFLDNPRPFVPCPVDHAAAVEDDEIWATWPLVGRSRDPNLETRRCPNCSSTQSRELEGNPPFTREDFVDLVQPHTGPDGPFEGEVAGVCPRCRRASFWWRAQGVNGPFAACEDHAPDVAFEHQDERDVAMVRRGLTPGFAENPGYSVGDQVVRTTKGLTKEQRLLVIAEVGVMSQDNRGRSRPAVRAWMPYFDDPGDRPSSWLLEEIRPAKASEMLPGAAEKFLARSNPKPRRKRSETNVEYHKAYDDARHAALQRPGLHCYKPPGSEWTQCFLYLRDGQCQEMAMTEAGEVEEGVIWTLEDGHLRVNPDPEGEDGEEFDDWDELTPVETVPIPPTATWPRRDADSKEWQEFRRKYPPVPHSTGRRRDDR